LFDSFPALFGLVVVVDPIFFLTGSPCSLLTLSGLPVVLFAVPFHTGFFGLFFERLGLGVTFDTVFGDIGFSPFGERTLFTAT
jgi:hypothetical protein